MCYFLSFFITVFFSNKFKWQKTDILICISI